MAMSVQRRKEEGPETALVEEGGKGGAVDICRRISRGWLVS